MPCYADMIAIGGYPIEREDSKVELVLFVSMNLDECDPETQAIFEKDCFYSVGCKIMSGFYKGKKRAKMIVSISTHLSILNKVNNLNKCLLKTSLVGVSQELPQVVENDNTSIFKLLISDYIRQEHSFIIKLVFPRFNTWFVNLKIRPQNSLIFVVGQFEVIDSDFYIYAKDFMYISTYFSSKQNIFDNVSLDNLSEVTNFTHAKLLSTYRSIVGNSKDILEDKGSLMNSGSKIDNSQASSLSLDNRSFSKRVKVEDFDESSDEVIDDDNSNVDKSVHSDEMEESVKKNKSVRSQNNDVNVEEV
ncbi:1149_t:CDS:2 [Dentiscutata erythropus]|uniref:1149_t:CDS:1 n=1 Tax=Dentiscutata erythropus TaxID=1348616 RepID=A0A9N9DGE8_9GLOM|nr:1149_t:CDS:2 [Dentiscutata erythropus]